MNLFETVHGVDVGADSAIASFNITHPSDSANTLARTRLFKGIEKTWMPEAARAGLLREWAAEFPGVWVIEETFGSWPSFQTARGFERGQSRWYGALRLLSVEPVFCPASVWHAQLRIRDIATQVDNERASAGLPKIKRELRLKAAVAKFLKEEIGHVAGSHNEADALAMCIAVHRGLADGSMTLGGKGERKQVERTAGHSGRAGRARKHSRRQQ